MFLLGFFCHVYLDAKGCPLLDCLAFLFEDSKPDVLQLPVLVSVPLYSSVVRCTTTFGTTKSSIETYKRYATRDSTLELALFVGDQFSWISWVIYPYPRIYVFTKEQQSSKLWNITMHQSSYQQICVFTNQKKIMRIHKRWPPTNKNDFDYTEWVLLWASFGI